MIHGDLGAELWWHYSADYYWPFGRIVLAQRRRGDNRFTDAITSALIIAHSRIPE